ncbi:MAG: hypothetical protein ABJF04_06810 [Reichenbachiella sp.]|uniref:hypothetical protein n=1 Tax=Reichenbachiella sp. TaxID=2184521 RepID=UPI003266998C
MPFSGRLTEVIDSQFDGNKRKFSKKTGIPYTSVVEFANGVKSDPKLSFLVKVLEVIGYENIVWLTNGFGKLKNQKLQAKVADKMLEEDPEASAIKQKELETMISQLKQNLDERGKMIKVQDELIENLKKNK